MLVVVKSFEAFNKRRYSDPWVAKVSPDGRLDFSERCGGYTGGYHTGDAGDLYIVDPLEGAIYAYGQNDRQKKTITWSISNTKMDGSYLYQSQTL